MNSPNVLDVPNRDNPQPFYCCDIFFNNYFEYQNHTQEVHAQSHYTMEGSTLNNQYQPDFEYTTADLTGFSPQSSYHSSFDRTYASSGYGSNHTGPTVMDQFHITPASSAVPSRTGSPVSGYSVSVLPEQNYNTSPFMGLLYPTMNQGNSHLGVRYPLQSLIPPINAIQFRNEPELSNTQSFQQEFDDYFCDTDPVQKNDSFGIYPIDNSHQRPLSESGSAKDTFIKSPMMPAHAPDLGSSSNRGNKITKKTKSIQRMDLKSEEVTSLQSFDGKPHKCTIDNCGKLYKTQNGLKYHRVYHHGALPSSAPSSPKASEPIEFDFPDNVRPSYVHPMFRRYKCLVGVCDKKYKNMSGLRYHIANAHPEISEDIQKQYLNSSKERGNNGEFAEFPESLAPEVE
jgi:hypothetical protein